MIHDTLLYNMVCIYVVQVFLYNIKYLITNEQQSVLTVTKQPAKCHHILIVTCVLREEQRQKRNAEITRTVPTVAGSDLFMWDPATVRR